MLRHLAFRSAGRIFVACATLTGVGWLGLALAAPPPSIRSVAPGNSAPVDAPGLDAGPSRVCGTRVERGLLDLMRERIGRTLATPLPTAYSTDTLGIAVLEDDGRFFYSGPGGHPVADVAGIAQAFYRTHGDDYDALAIYLSSGLTTWLGSATALAAAYPIVNDVSGIGLDLFDFHAGLALPPHLHTLLSMNGLNRYPMDPDQNFDDPGDTFNTMDVLAHEFAHRWCAYVYVDSAGMPVPALLGRARQHWNFFADVDASVMEGCDWISPAPDSFLTDGASLRYGRLDQYLMGLRSKSEIDSFFVVNQPTALDPPGVYGPTSVPETGVGCHGRATWWHISDIEAVHGPRLPDAASSPHAFHVATLLVTPHGSGPSAEDLSKLAGFRTRFVPYFASATEGRGTMDLSLISQAGRVHITHAPLHDTEDFATPRPIGARVTIDQAGIRLAVDPGSVRARVRNGAAGAWTEVPLAAVAPDSFAAMLPGVPQGTAVEYYLTASSDSAGIEASDPKAGAAGPYTYFAGPDIVPPLLTHVPIPTESPAHLPVTLLARITDNGALDTAWVETSVNGGPLKVAPLAIAGRDSFTTSLGAGLVAGHRLAYRFVARDRAALPNFGYSNPAFDTLVVGADWVEDLENGFPAGWQVVRQRRQDPWSLSHQRTHDGSGTAWKAGALDTLPYPAHLDGTIYTPFFSGFAPEAVLTFDHWWDLEEQDGHTAADGAILEVQQGSSGAWTQVPMASYSHQSFDVALGIGVPCWSGSSNGWRSEVVALYSYAPGPVRFRFHMAADDFVGREGWYVDHVRLLAANPGALAVPRPGVALRIGAPSPNPARARLSQALDLPRASNVSWDLFDLAGRHIATLWRGRREAGAGALAAPLPRLSSGLYFVRVTLDGVRRSIARVAIVR